MVRLAAKTCAVSRPPGRNFAKRSVCLLSRDGFFLTHKLPFPKLTAEKEVSKEWEAGFSAGYDSRFAYPY